MSAFARANLLERAKSAYSQFASWHRGWVAQLAEQRTENPRVGGSIPPPATPRFSSEKRTFLPLKTELSQKCEKRKKTHLPEKKVSCNVMHDACLSCTDFRLALCRAQDGHKRANDSSAVWLASRNSQRDNEARTEHYFHRKENSCQDIWLRSSIRGCRSTP
jgi:hypothetical protein